MVHTGLFRNALFLMTLAACATPCFGQAGASVLLGEVRDESAALVAGVTVTAVSDATGFRRAAVTGSEGSYRIEHLLPGRYTVEAAKEGFRTQTVHGIDLRVEQKGELNLTLAVGTAHDSVVVTAAVSPLAERDASVAYRLDSAAILDLPLASHDLIPLVTLGPGAIPRHLGGFTHDEVNDVQAVRGAVALNPPMNGARSTANSFLVDGADDTDRNTFAIAVIPPMESVGEFRVVSSLAPSELAQSGGGVVDIVTRAGSKEYHGSAFEYFRNEATDARNYFETPSLPRAIFRQQQFGGSLGGPMFPKPSTFFFAAYEGMRGKAAKSTQSTVPDATVRSGVFGGPIFDPLNVTAAGTRNPFPGNAIPGNRIDAAARQFLSGYEPLPNSSSPSGNYLDTTPSDNTLDSGSVRLDHQFRNQNQLFGRYTLNNSNNRIAGNFPVLPVTENLRAQQLALGLTSGSATLANEVRLAFTRLSIADVPESAFRANIAQQLGITGLSTDPSAYGLPVFQIATYSAVTDDPTLPQLQHDNLWNLSEGLTWLRGRHTVKLGAQFTRFQMNYRRSDRVRGDYVFTGAFTNDGSAAGTGGDAFADFLLGYPQVTFRTVGASGAYLRQNIYSGYVQDEWKAGSRLTLTFGLRYTYFAPFADARGQLYNLDYSGLPAPPKLVNVATAANPDLNNLAPHASLAWRLPRAFRSAAETVLRAGYGIYYSPDIAAGAYDLVRNQVRNERNQTNGVTPILTIENGFPATASTGFPTYFGADLNARTPYIQQWTASIQHSLRGGVLLEVAYLGTRGTKLGRIRRFNTPLAVETGANLPPRPGDLQSLRPFPGLGVIIQRQNIANSSYHSLQVKADKRLSGGLGFLTSFVWSKSIDDTDSTIVGYLQSAGAQDERNLRLERALSSFNTGRRFSTGFTYSIPTRVRGRNLLARLVMDWEFSGIVTLQDGMPMNVLYYAYDGANTGTPNRPNVVAGQSLSLPRSQRTAAHFFNTAAFATPPAYTFGNAGRNILPGPGNNQFDLSAHRRFPLRESRVVEFRSEFFNAFNHPNWGIPGPYPDFGPFFGKIFACGDPRRIQLGLRFDY